MASTGGVDSLGRREQDPAPSDTAPSSRQSPPAKIQLTSEEMEVLQECSRESFWLRSVPLAMVLMGGTHIFVRKGILAPHPRLGALPKSMFSGLVAYVLGKISYQGECRRKIMNLENSPLAEAMRKGKRGRELMGEMSLSGLGGYEPSSSGQSVEIEKRLLADSYDSNSQAPELDDAQRPNIDNAMEQPVQQETRAQYLSYDELRKRNRLEYEQRASPLAPARQTPPAPSAPPQPGQAPPSPPAPSRGYERRMRTNKYGDVIED